jgi:hypothetical protein
MASPALASGPKNNFSDAKLNDELQNAYHDLATALKAPSIFRGAGAPAFTPKKEGDIYISTTTSKVYISTATATSGSWAIMN